MRRAAQAARIAAAGRSAASKSVAHSAWARSRARYSPQVKSGHALVVGKSSAALHRRSLATTASPVRAASLARTQRLIAESGARAARASARAKSPLR